MPKPDPALKSRASRLLNAAEMALLEAASRALRFEDAEDFKRSLIKSLETHPVFGREVRDFHAPMRMKAGGSSKASGARPRVQKGRVQGSRVERGVRDRKAATRKFERGS